MTQNLQNDPVMQKEIDKAHPLGGEWNQFFLLERLELELTVQVWVDQKMLRRRFCFWLVMMLVSFI